MERKEVDARGLSCPEPVIRTKQAIESIEQGKIEVLLDEEVAKENVSRISRNAGCQVEISEANGEYKLLLTKE